MRIYITFLDTQGRIHMAQTEDVYTARLIAESVSNGSCERCAFTNPNGDVKNPILYRHGEEVK